MTANKFNPADMFGNFGKEAFENFMKVGQQTMAQSFEKSFGTGKEQFSKAASQTLKSYDDMVALGTANVEAVVKAGTILAQGVAEMQKQMFAQAQAEIETGMESYKAIFACKNVQDMMTLQGKLTQVNMDKAVAQSSKLSEMTVKVANEAAQPISAQVNVAVEKFMKPLAA
jgi:phasin family protein